jgi:hypothetical protein
MEHAGWGFIGEWRMTTFDERERAFEKRFSMDQDFKFKAASRRNKLVGEWAAARLGISGPAIGDYVKAVIKADLAETGDGAFHKIRKDFADRGVVISDGELRTAMAEFLRAAVRQIEDAAPG